MRDSGSMTTCRSSNALTIVSSAATFAANDVRSTSTFFAASHSLSPTTLTPSPIPNILIFSRRLYAGSSVAQTRPYGRGVGVAEDRRLAALQRADQVGEQRRLRRRRCGRRRPRAAAPCTRASRGRRRARLRPTARGRCSAEPAGHLRRGTSRCCHGSLQGSPIHNIAAGEANESPILTRRTEAIV
jgi:hypothetical protein